MRITARQEAIVALYRRAATEGAAPPTLRELCSYFGWSSTGTARDHLSALVKKGVLQRTGRKSRGYLLARRPAQATSVPILGRVPAGQPLLAEESHLGEAIVPRAWVSSEGAFAVGVTGDSMSGAGIVEGDLVVAHPAEMAHDGDIVIARSGEDATVKRLERRGSSVRLMPENPAHEPVVVDEDTRIVGVAVGLLRDMRPRKLRGQVRHG